jgi:SAM-dependent methyltransferase
LPRMIPIFRSRSAVARVPGMADHSILLTGNLLMIQERERLLAKLLRKGGWENLEELRVFEAGCSTGYNLRQLVQWGARPEHVAGIDLNPEAVEYCRSRSSEVRVHLGSADAIPEPPQSFDLALAFTLFSSVPEETVAAGIASELLRITRPGGLILVYDMRRKSPHNPNVHPITKQDLRRWFPGSRMLSRSITLAPPLARRVGSFAPWLYGPLAAIPPFRTHTITIIRRHSNP